MRNHGDYSGGCLLLSQEFLELVEFNNPFHFGYGILTLEEMIHRFDFLAKGTSVARGEIPLQEFMCDWDMTGSEFCHSNGDRSALTFNSSFYSFPPNRLCCGVRPGQTFLPVCQGNSC